MVKPKDVFQAAVGYVRKNPNEVVHALANAAALRFGLPLAALRYFASHVKPGRKMPKDVQIGSSPPALRLSAIVDAMGTSLRTEAAIGIEGVSLSEESVRVTLRLRDVKLSLVGESESPIATLVKSGALDLSKPGNLIKFLPNRTPAIVEAEDDRIVIDLMKVKKVAANLRLRKALAVTAPLIGIRAVETDGDHLYVTLRATPSGFKKALEALRT